MAIGAKTELENSSNLLVKGDVMYSSYISDSNLLLNSFGVAEFDVHFSDNLKLLRNYLLAQGSTTVNQTELNNLVFGNGVFEINNNLNLANGGEVKFIGDDNSVLILNINGDLNIGDNSRIQIEGIRPENIFWNVSGKIILGSFIEIYGVFLSHGELLTGQNIYGERMLLSDGKINLGPFNQDISSYNTLFSLSILMQESLAENNCNLVNNYSFESLWDCPVASGSIGKAKFWFEAGANSGRVNNNTLQPLITENRTRFLGNGYPNPANNKFYIPYKTDNITNSYMEIYDINGSLITKRKITTKQGTIVLDLDQLSSGIYFYKLLINGTQVEVKRLAKIK